MDFVNFVADAFKASGLQGNIYPSDTDVSFVMIPRVKGGEKVDLIVFKRQRDVPFVIALACGTASGEIKFQVPTVPLTEESLRDSVTKLIDWAKAWASSTPT